MLKYRPLSPHLSTYSIQISSLYSIWHRVTGVCNLLLLLSIIILIKLIIWGRLISSACFLQFCLGNYKFVLGVVFLSVIYHILNGYRHLMWDSNLIFTQKAISLSSFILVLLFVFVYSINWIPLFL